MTKGILEYDREDPPAIAELEMDYFEFLTLCKERGVDESKWPSLKRFANLRRQLMNE